MLGLIVSIQFPNPKDWRKRSVYQLLINRFASPTNKPCNVYENKYCGGTINAMTEKLDYIQGMGYNAVWISPTLRQAEDVE
jgi:alpha-amylase